MCGNKIVVLNTNMTRSYVQFITLETDTDLLKQEKLVQRRKRRRSNRLNKTRK